jgi:hypothetical protein
MGEGDVFAVGHVIKPAVGVLFESQGTIWLHQSLPLRAASYFVALQYQKNVGSAFLADMVQIYLILLNMHVFMSIKIFLFEIILCCNAIKMLDKSIFESIMRQQEGNCQASVSRKDLI